MILTRFSRVTFNAAHNYLGLTTEVLRTEKAINDIACHPLPQSFYEGGLRQLRQRFDGVSIASDSDSESDYFSYPPSQNPSSKSSLFDGLKKAPKATPGVKYSPATPLKVHGSRHFVQAGDLLTSAGHNGEGPWPMARMFSTFVMPTPRQEHAPGQDVNVQRLATDEFDLREEVMSCIAKSIGLIQPPISGDESVEASPAFPPSNGRHPSSPAGASASAFRSSFGSLSLLELGDDASSSRTESSSSVFADGYLSNLDNEVEILYFPAGSILAKAGERNTGRPSKL